MLRALLISNGIAGLEAYYVSNELVEYTTCSVTPDFDPDLRPYDLLVVPNGSDHVAMLKIREKVRAFLDAGNALVCADGWFTAWVPGNQWAMDNQLPTREVRYQPGPDRHGLLAGVDLEELIFSHGISGWWACGYLQAAPGAEVLLADTWQRPVLVLDEVSTRGRMLLSASGPLTDSNRAGQPERALVTLYRNFLRLLESHPRPFFARCAKSSGSEGPDDRKTALTGPDGLPAPGGFRAASGERPGMGLKEKRAKIGLLFNGVWSHYALATAPKYRDLYQLLYLHDLDADALRGLAALAVPFQTNHQVLAEKKQLIYDFLAAGGNVFVEGDSSASWLAARWEDRPVNNYWWVTAPHNPPVLHTDFTHPVYQGLTPRHAGWHTHGAYTQVPAGAEIIQTAPNGDIITWQTHEYGGALLVTTLDPLVEHGVQQITHLDHYVDRLTEWLGGVRPAPGRLTIDAAAYGPGAAW